MLRAFRRTFALLPIGLGEGGAIQLLAGLSESAGAVSQGAGRAGGLRVPRQAPAYIAIAGEDPQPSSYPQAIAASTSLDTLSRAGTGSSYRVPCLPIGEVNR